VTDFWVRGPGGVYHAVRTLAADRRVTGACGRRWRTRKAICYADNRHGRVCRACQAVSEQLTFAFERAS
jgi:hypothetical protein